MQLTKGNHYTRRLVKSKEKQIVKNELIKKGRDYIHKSKTY